MPVAARSDHNGPAMSRNRLHYAWIVAAVTFVVLLITRASARRPASDGAARDRVRLEPQRDLGGGLAGMSFLTLGRTTFSASRPQLAVQS